MTAALPRGADRVTQAFTGLVGRDDLTLPVALGAILLSIVFGAVHALAPGHGKTVLAAYLVGQRGTRRQAVWLGAAVTISHTGSVLALGALLVLGSVAAPERVVPIAEVLSGLLLVGVGGWLLWSALARRRAGRDGGHAHNHDHDHDHDHPHDGAHDHEHPHDVAHDHDHPHDDEHPHDDAHDRDHGHPHDGADGHDHEHPHDRAHGHDHPHDHGHGDAAEGTRGSVATQARPAAAVHSHGGRAHSHGPIDARPLGWRSLAAMGLAGGLVPSPSALVVLLGATALGRAPFGVLLVVGYGVGMALTLTAAGLLLLRAQAALNRRGWRLGSRRWSPALLPSATAAVVVLVGLGLVVRGIGTGSALP